MAERGRPWRDVIAALEADIMILEGIEHRHPEIELRPTITNIHLAIQGIMDLITESQGGEPTPKAPESDVTEPPPVSGVDTTVERLEPWMAEYLRRHSQSCIPEGFFKGQQIGTPMQAVNEAIADAIRDALTLIHDLQVEAASQERWADEYKAERDTLQAENARVRASDEQNADLCHTLKAEKERLREVLREDADIGLGDAWAIVKFYEDVVRSFQQEYGVGVMEWLSDMDWDSVETLRTDAGIHRNAIRQALTGEQEND